MSATHRYETLTVWTGNRGTGTSDYRAYDRSFETSSPGRADIEGSSDPAFRGDDARWNPELLLVAALSECHLLSYLHRCAVNSVVVHEYLDRAEGAMEEDSEGGGRFTEVVLRPTVVVAEASMMAAAERLHEEAASKCFIAASVSFPVRHEPRTFSAPTAVR